MTDEAVSHPARQRAGVVTRDDLGVHPARAARRAGLEVLRPGAYVARTQPVGPEVVVVAVRQALHDRRWALLGESALWWYELAGSPSAVDIGVPLGCMAVVPRGATCRRVAEQLLDGVRRLRDVPVVAVEVAVVQYAADHADAQVRRIVEEAVRRRTTTLTRLRARCRRGVKGSARVRRICDELAGCSLDEQVRRLRAALELRGVTGLEVEPRFTNAAGASAYADLLHRETMTAIEVDGYLTHSERDRFLADRRRDRWLRAEHGVTTIRIDVAEVVADVDRVADEVAAMILAARTRSA